MDYIKLEIDTLNTIRSGLIKQIETIDKRLETIQTNSEFKCVDCSLVFQTQEQLDKHLVGKKHNDKIGVSPINCSACTNSFYGADLVKHVEDGRCAKSRTCKGCRVIFNTMMRKSRHTCSKRYLDEADNCKNVTKKKKLKIVTKPKKPEPLPVVEEPPAAPPPTPEPSPDPVPEPVPEKKKESMFVYDKPKYKLGELPATLDNVTRDWYESLHNGITDGDRYFYKMEESARCIDNLQDDTPMRLEDGIIYEIETGDKWFKMENIDNQYYKLTDMAPVEPPPVIWPKLERIDIVDNLECLSSLGERNMTEDLYRALHKHHQVGQHDFLPDDILYKFHENCSDIADCAYQSGEYLYYDHNGYLCRGKDRLFRFYRHSSGLFYDMEACEGNLCDEEFTTEDELDLDGDLIR